MIVVGGGRGDRNRVGSGGAGSCLALGGRRGSTRLALGAFEGGEERRHKVASVVGAGRDTGDLPGEVGAFRVGPSFSFPVGSWVMRGGGDRCCIDSGWGVGRGAVRAGAELLAALAKEAKLSGKVLPDFRVGAVGAVPEQMEPSSVVFGIRASPALFGWVRRTGSAADRILGDAEVDRCAVVELVQRGRLEGVLVAVGKGGSVGVFAVNGDSLVVSHIIIRVVIQRRGGVVGVRVPACPARVK